LKPLVQKEIAPQHTIEPIPALIAFIKDKYQVDTEAIIKEYENKIRMKEESQ
jgi:hypothetical protein